MEVQDFRSYKLVVWEQVLHEGAWGSAVQRTLVTSGLEGSSTARLELCVCPAWTWPWTGLNQMEGNSSSKGCPEPAVLGSSWVPWLGLPGRRGILPSTALWWVLNAVEAKPDDLSSREQGQMPGQQGRGRSDQESWVGIPEGLRDRGPFPSQVTTRVGLPAGGGREYVKSNHCLQPSLGLCPIQAMVMGQALSPILGRAYELAIVLRGGCP